MNKTRYTVGRIYRFLFVDGTSEPVEYLWWHAKRAAFIARMHGQAVLRGEPPRDAKGQLTRRSLALIAWAFDPEATSDSSSVVSISVARRHRNMHSEDMKTTRYLVRSNINPALVLCTDGEFHADAVIGPGTDLSARLYKTRRGAESVRGGAVIVRECDERGVEVVA